MLLLFLNVIMCNYLISLQETRCIRVRYEILSIYSYFITWVCTFIAKTIVRDLGDYWRWWNVKRTITSTISFETGTFACNFRFVIIYSFLTGITVKWVNIQWRTNIDATIAYRHCPSENFSVLVTVINQKL